MCSGVCDYHSDIGVQCLPLFDQVTPHWRGLKFENAESKETLSYNHVLYDSISLSQLRHVDIVRAGTGRGGSAEAAISVMGVPPVLEFVTIDHSSYTGINVTRHDVCILLRLMADVCMSSKVYWRSYCEIMVFFVVKKNMPLCTICFKLQHHAERKQK